MCVLCAAVAVQLLLMYCYSCNNVAILLLRYALRTAFSFTDGDSYLLHF
jgi:hypothetical protein